MPRPQVSLKTLLWLMVVVAAFLGGSAWQKHRDEPLSHSKTIWNDETSETMILRDGTVWRREFDFRAEVNGDQVRAVYAFQMGQNGSGTFMANERIRHRAVV